MEAPTLAEPGRSYIVCATPRSGSTLLCATLAATGVAGRPEEFFEARHPSGFPRRPGEFFEGAAAVDRTRVPDAAPPLHDYADVRAAGGFLGHLDAVRRRGTTANGVFGAKLMWMHVGDLLAYAREAGTPPATGLGTLLDVLVPGARFVWVRREDGVAQAVSLWKAMQTQAWRDGDGGVPDAEPGYDFAALDHLVGRLAGEDDAWRSWFAASGTAPLTLTYEAIGADPYGAACAVAELVGVTLPTAGEPGPALRRQADERSAEWARRYRLEAR
jgi:LPS sulfotransferase NodH